MLSWSLWGSGGNQSSEKQDNEQNSPAPNENNDNDMAKPKKNEEMTNTISNELESKNENIKKSTYYTFNPIQYHYSKVSKNVNDKIVWHSTPISISITTLQNTFDNLTLSSPSKQSQTDDDVDKTKMNDATKEKENENEKENKKEKEKEEEEEQSNHGEKLMIRYLDSLPIESSEKKTLLELHEWISNDTLSIKMKDELCFGDLIMSYFSSFSPTNPDAKGCWKRWAAYCHDIPLNGVDFRRIREFFDSGFYNVGYDKQNRPVFIFNSKHQDTSFGPEIITKASILLLTSLLWNINTNSFDFDALKKGISFYMDLSHYSISTMSWNSVQACKLALIAFPFQLGDLYCINTPTFIYILRQIAAKVIVPHAMERVKIVGSSEEYFEKYGLKEKTPEEKRRDLENHCNTMDERSWFH